MAFNFGTDPLRRMSGQPFNTNPIMGQAPQMTDPAQAMSMPAILASQEAKPSTFGKGGKGWQILGIIGDALQAAGGGRGTYLPAMLDMQQQVEAEKRWQAKLSQDAQLKREELEAQARNKSPYRWEDNAGNVWERGPDGQNNRIFTDTIPKMYIQGNQAIEVPNPFAIAPERPVGKLTVIDAPVAAPTAPARTITQSEFLRMRRAMGPEKAMNWLRSNNIAIGN